jgi:2-oxoisovalerate dehydrogenase E2 component (dihydrolipoyl transacylase)
MMGNYAIKMPDIGEGIAEVELVEWRVKPGDEVVEDQILADVMTDKATVEIPSPVTGRVESLGGVPGQILAVGAELIRLEVEGQGNVGKEAPAQAAASPKKAATGTVVPKTQPLSSQSSLQVSSEPPDTRFKDKSETASVPASRQKTLREDLASPAVRKRAWDLGIELQFVDGSGPDGRVTHDDLDAYSTGRLKPVVSGSVLKRRSGGQDIQIIGLRRKIAQKMQESKRRIPHFSYVEEVDVTELEELRHRLNAKYAGERNKLTLLPFIVRAVVQAVEDFPQMNARFDDDAGVVTRHQPVHVGIATQTDSGLMVPVMHHAEEKSLWDCAVEVNRLATSTRAGSAGKDELSGSTITISSLGTLGGIASTPIINHPEVAIVGVNRMIERPMYRGGVLVPRKVMNLSSSFDHRVVDGMDAAQFIQAIRASLECPAMLFLE